MTTLSQLEIHNRCLVAAGITSDERESVALNELALASVDPDYRRPSNAQRATAEAALERLATEIDAAFERGALRRREEQIMSDPIRRAGRIGGERGAVMTAEINSRIARHIAAAGSISKAERRTIREAVKQEYRA